MKPRTLWIALLLAPSVAMLGGPAAALTTTTYNLATGCTVNSGFKNGSLVAGGGATFTPGTCTGSGALSSLTGISDTGISGGASSFTLQTAYIGVYGTNLGLTSTAGQTTSGGTSLDGTTGILATGTTADTGNGITSETTNAPSHALDNQYNHEATLLSFNTAVSLTDIRLGYYNTDSDITLYAYTASQAPVGIAATGLLGSTYATLAGWTKIGDYANVGGATCSGDCAITSSSHTAIATSTLSSYWLIAAYTGSSTTGSLTTGNDFVKLLTATACTGAAGCLTGGSGGVPEPSTVLLMGAALLPLSQMRRSRTA